jgi:hypothetical protein
VFERAAVAERAAAVPRCLPGTSQPAGRNAGEDPLLPGRCRQGQDFARGSVRRVDPGSAHRLGLPDCIRALAEFRDRPAAVISAIVAVLLGGGCLPACLAATTTRAIFRHFLDIERRLQTSLLHGRGEGARGPERRNFCGPESGRAATWTAHWTATGGSTIVEDTGTIRAAPEQGLSGARAGWLSTTLPGELLLILCLPRRYAVSITNAKRARAWIRVRSYAAKSAGYLVLRIGRPHPGGCPVPWSRQPLPC